MVERTVGTTPPRVMTIAGTDSGGGAGVAADLRALAACGVHGCVAVTAVTVQNSVGVTGVHTLPPEIVAAQIEAVATDIGLDAVKTGMLATTPIIQAIAEACDRTGIGGDGPTPLVVDPVAASMHGDPLLADSALDAYRTVLFPRATVVTPNLDEVRLLVGIDVHDRAAQYEAAKLLHAMGPRYVLVKGGHLVEDVDVCVDLLYDGHTFTELSGPRFATGDTHGSGDNMASATAAGLARGMAVPEAVAFGKRFVVEAVRHAYPLGAGHGPVSPLWAIDPWWER
jgi:hydroxymethylpyrimidine/phosphomethylpyrimidine kinase